MPETGLSVTQQRMQDKRERILDAALTLFAERGFHGTAVPRVAERAGVGAGTIYRFFESKEALVNAVFRRAKVALGDALLEDFCTRGEPRDVFERFWQRLADFAQQHPVTFHFLELQDHAPYLDAQSRALELRVLGPIHALVASWQRAGALRGELPAPTLMALVWGAFVGVVKAERLGYASLDAAALARAGDACWRAFASPALDSTTR